jgi:hypothetical protein
MERSFEAMFMMRSSRAICLFIRPLMTSAMTLTERRKCLTGAQRLLQLLLLLVDLSFLHHELNMLEFANVGDRIAAHRDDVRGFP